LANQKRLGRLNNQISKLLELKQEQYMVLKENDHTRYSGIEKERRKIVKSIKKSTMSENKKR